LPIGSVMVPAAAGACAHAGPIAHPAPVNNALDAFA
jgi:hypothetical protein